MGVTMGIYTKAESIDNHWRAFEYYAEQLAELEVIAMYHYLMYIAHGGR